MSSPSLISRIFFLLFPRRANRAPRSPQAGLCAPGLAEGRAAQTAGLAEDVQDSLSPGQLGRSVQQPLPRALSAERVRSPGISVLLGPAGRLGRRNVGRLRSQT